MYYTYAILYSAKTGLATVDLTQRLERGQSLSTYCFESLGIEHPEVLWMFMLTFPDKPEQYKLVIGMSDGDLQWEFYTIDPIEEIWLKISLFKIDIRKITSISIMPLPPITEIERTDDLVEETPIWEVSPVGGYKVLSPSEYISSLISEAKSSWHFSRYSWIDDK